MMPRLLTVLFVAAMALVPSTATFAQPEVFPVPQRVEFTGKSTTVSKVTIEKRRRNSRGGVWDVLPKTPGGYGLLIEKGHLRAWVNDEDGLYYAKQTLSQLLEGVKGAQNAQADPFSDKSLAEVARLGKLPEGAIVDWPDLTERGVVEGYYGTPWSMEARKSLFRFYGRNKMNLYIYGPKDDRYHHGWGCYEPYPADKARELAELVKAARENHVRFVWAIHPANTVDWNKDGGRPQLDKLCTKLESLYKLGVRDFGVFVDDSFGEIGKPERQAQLCNYILEHFIRKHPRDVTPYLIMVPTGYNRAWTNPQYLGTLGRELDPSTRVMWTGNTVVNDITLAGQKWVHEHLGRPTFIWWNWPCSDFKRGRLSMGRTYGLGTETEMKGEMTGFTANPMEQAEANKVGLFGVADYCWNITAFQSDHSWREGIKRLYPECPEAMQAFCDHNSYLLPNGHGYYREESVAMHELARAFIESVNRWEPDEELARKLREEYRRIIIAGRTLGNPIKGASPELKALQKEIQPWLRSFAHMGRAGNFIISSILDSKKKGRREDFFRTVDSLCEMSRMARMDWNNGQPKPRYDVEVGSYIMTPALREAFRYSNAIVYSDFSGLKPTALLPTFTSSVGTAQDGAEKIRDGNVGSFWESRCRQEAGQWFCLDFGEPISIMNVCLLMGTGQRPNDYPESGQLEYSLDGSSWTPLGKEHAGASVIVKMSRKPRKARMLRYRITRPRPNWLAIAEFKVNSTPPPFVQSTVEGYSGLMPFRDEKQFGINRIMEVHTITPGQTISLHIPEPVLGTWLEVNLSNDRIDQWARIEVKPEEGKAITLNPTREGTKLIAKGGALPREPLTAIKLTHKGKSPEQISLHTFKLDVPALEAGFDPRHIADTDFGTWMDCSKGLEYTMELPPGTRRFVIVGSASCTLNGKKGKTSGLAQTFPIEKGMKKVTIKAAPQAGKVVYEAIPCVK